MKHILSILLIAILIVGCKKQNHFITNEKYRNEVKAQFEKRKIEFAARGAELFGIFSRPDIPLEQTEALEFLYAYMSANDLADYDCDFFHKQVKTAFEARDFFRWGKSVPEDLFRHFVLPPRVNNENLDTARILFFAELKERVKNMNMYQAALEVNHWCHEKVTYRGSDIRTSAPLATLRTAYGRCGEESTFTVTALRAVGIPARQCYTPRWAHTDDNHAWVEVWCDGKWYFMGACEPEPELNMAWFTNPAKRAMMVHTNVFGKYYGPESKTTFPLYTKINVLENYTETKKLTVTVTDENSAPVENADVKFGLYNYAEYYPVYEAKTDKNGNATIISGLGDLVVWAVKDSKYNYKQVSLAETSQLTLKLERTPGKEYTDDFDLTPPADKSGYPKESIPGAEENSKRLRYEDSLRNAYLATFATKEHATALALKHKLDTAKVISFVLKSEGNYKAIMEFIENNANNENTLPLLGTLTEKDLRDTPAEILQNHLNNTKNNGLSADVFIEGVLSPRIATELIINWRSFLQNQFKDIFKNTPQPTDIKNWITQNITIIPDDQNYSKCIISPTGVSKTRMADKISRNVFFVALCRSLNIPAKIDMATGEIKVFGNNAWKTFYIEPQAPEKNEGELILNYNSKNDIIPLYLSYYSIAKFDNGVFTQLDYETDPRVGDFPIRLNLEEGYYRLTSGNRYANGKVLAHNDYFNITKKQTTQKELLIRDLQFTPNIYGNIKAIKTTENYYKQNGMIICFIDPDREPTKHTMKDISLYKKEFDKWKGSFIFVVPEDNLSKSFSANQYHALPENTTFITGNGNQLMNDFLKSANQSFRYNYPLIYVINTNGDIIFHTEGYRIGTGDLLLKTVKN